MIYLGINLRTDLFLFLLLILHISFSFISPFFIASSLTLFLWGVLNQGLECSGHLFDLPFTLFYSSLPHFHHLHKLSDVIFSNLN